MNGINLFNEQKNNIYSRPNSRLKRTHIRRSDCLLRLTASASTNEPKIRE